MTKPNWLCQGLPADENDIRAYAAIHGFVACLPDGGLGLDFLFAPFEAGIAPGDVYVKLRLALPSLPLMIEAQEGRTEARKVEQ